MSTAEIFVSEDHIDPLRDKGYVIYKLGYVHPVVDGVREVSMLWGNVRGGGSVIHNKTKEKQGGSVILDQFYHLDLAQVNKLHNPATIDPASANALEIDGNQVLKFKGVPITADTPIIKIDNGSTESKVSLGYLYPFWTCIDARNIAALGMGMPSKADWDILCDNLGGWEFAGGKLKEVGNGTWLAPNTDATDEVGFGAKSTGLRASSFSSLGSVCQFQSSTQNTPNETGTNNFISVIYYANGEFVTAATNPRHIGNCVRLVRLATQAELLLPNGLIPATYTGNNNLIYPLVKINNQIWLAWNLKESKFRNGDAIVEITDNALWVAQGPGTGGRCSYQNLESNAVTVVPVLTSIPIGGTIFIPSKTSVLVNDSEFLTAQEAAQAYMTSRKTKANNWFFS